MKKEDKTAEVILSLKRRCDTLFDPAFASAFASQIQISTVRRAVGLRRKTVGKLR
ncbi:MAG: hypothetical protein OCU22_05345 [Canidatus Methanoxibalbensis ujae]|nr:hypothetical protein [Candidatus Methanoxibalbensis ujae]